MSTRHIILGLLAGQPMSGYDIKSLFKGLDWLIDVPSFGSLYPTLHALLEEQAVSVSIEPGQGKPERKLYRITEAGHHALQEWLQSPAQADLSIKAFARQLMLTDCLSSDELEDHLMSRRAQVEAYLTGTECAATQQVLENEHLGRRIIHDYGTAIAQAELAWLDARLTELQSAEVREGLSTRTDRQT